VTYSPDPEYELVEYKPTKRGRQCGKCWMKFDYNVNYGFYCQASDCPMGYAGSRSPTTSDPIVVISQS
jgi:hypothetical protein